ncbi:beta-mannanase [Synergistales bacterium]|nr:beta-mannanase [Synergistales bacterium]
MTRKIFFLLIILYCAIFASTARGAEDGIADPLKLLPPERGVYHSAHPDFGITDDVVSPGSVSAFTDAAERKIVWAFVAFNWGKDMKFPSEACRLIHDAGAVPLVGMMPWTERRQNEPEKRYTMARILRGEFDGELKKCAASARGLGFPIMMEFGPEVNGAWFPWNGAWNGRDEDTYGERGAPDGPERFRDAYRHIVRLFRGEGARDVTWAFHIDANPSPVEAWNSARYYYPGDDYIDWIGASVYGRLRGGKNAVPFDEMMTRRGFYAGLCSLSPEKPLAVFEIGVTDSPALGDKPQWIRAAYGSIKSGRYPRIRAVSWWNKKFRPDGTPSTLGIDSSPESLAAYRGAVRNLVTEARWSR